MSFSAYSEYKSSGVELFEKVPSRWSIQRLKQVVNPSRPITYGIVQAGENVPDGIPYIRPADMTDESGVKSEDTLLRTSPEIASSYKRSSIVAGDIVCSIGPSFGKLMMVPSSLEGSNLTQGTARVAVSQGNMPRFVFWVLKSVESYQQWESSIGGATFRALNLGPLAETFICVPGPAEQAQIARFLDHETARIDALIEEQQRLIELLKEKRQAVISHAVTKGLDPRVPMKDSGVEWLGVGPAHWSFKQSKYLLEFVTSGSRGWAEYYSDDGDLFFRIANLTRDSIEPKLLSIQYVTPPENAEGERSKVRYGDILISITADLGSVCVANNEVAGSYVSQHVALARPIKKTVFSRWFAYFVLSDACKDQLVGAGYGGTKVQLSLDDIRSFLVSMPPYEEQVLLAAFLDREIQAFDGLIAQATIGMGLLSERRSALISAAVTGKIDVRGWQPPASVPSPELVQEAV